MFRCFSWAAPSFEAPVILWFDQTVESIPADWVDDQCFVCADGLDADRDIAPVYRIQAVGVLLKHEAGRG
jgi:hypothetical protein